MNNYFTLENKKIFLWGNTSFAYKIYNNLLNDGIETSGIIEKNNTTIKELPIYTLNEIEDKYSKTEVIFVLCLKSSLNQEKLAEEIYKEGYHNIIFIPLTLSNAASTHHMRTNYEQLLYGDIKNLIFPIYDLFVMDDLEYRIVKYFRSDIEIVINIKYIRTFYRDNVIDELLCFRDRPIAEYDCLNELYDYFYNGGIYPKNYMQFYMNGTKDDSFLVDRKQLFETFKNGYELCGMSFFESIPIPVELKENGLNITDGMHRASFLFKEGFSMIPVILSISDFKEFVHRISEENKT